MSKDPPSFDPEVARRFHRMLHHLGWSLSALEAPVALKPFSRPADVQFAPLADGSAMLLVMVSGGPLPSLESAYRAYEDFTGFHRELQLALARQGWLVRNSLLIDEALGAQLIDFQAEDVLLEARGVSEFEERVLPLLSLANVSRGSIATFPRKTPRQRARELFEWTKVWSGRLGASAGAPREYAERFFHWLHLARLAERLEIGSEKSVSFASYALQSKLNPVRFLMSAFGPLRDRWNLLQGAPLETQQRIADAAHAAGELEPCLQSFGLLSVGKFASDIFAEAFSDEELRISGWRHQLMEKELKPEPDPSRWLSGPIVIDLDTTGFPGVIRQYDRIVEDLRTLAREQAVALERGERPGYQLDLLGEAPPRIEEEDAPIIALQSALKVRTGKAAREAAARMVLLAHTAQWHARLRQPEPIFPAPQVDRPRRNKGMSNPESN